MVKKKTGKSTQEDLFKIASFILLDTMIFHEFLSNREPRVKSLITFTNLQLDLTKQWNMIIKTIDYKPIFQLGLKVIKNLPTAPTTNDMLLRLRELAISIISSGVLLRHDLMGRIYHKLLLKTTGSYYATYYTSIPAAVLLSHLIIKTENPHWDFSDEEKIKQFRLIDPACGSGTLLSASYSAIRDQYIIESISRDVNKLHTSLMENCIWGFDVQDFATHLTLTTLALHNPNSSFDDSNIYTIPNGVKKAGKHELIYLGSLDYLRDQTRLAVKDWVETPTKKKIDEDEELYETVIVKPKSFDVVIMNPPFSRSAKPNLKFGYVPEDIKKKMSKELTKLTAALGYQGIGQAGLGANFIVVGDKLLRQNGRIGVVLPRGFLSGVSWQKIRDLLYNDYEIEYIISNYDLGDKEVNVEPWNWSEQTDIGEVLIIARKVTQKKTIEDKVVHYVNILEKPKNEVESLILTQDIFKAKKALGGLLLDKKWEEIIWDDVLKAVVYKVPQEKLSTNFQLPCLFFHPEINHFLLKFYEEITAVKMENLVPKEVIRGRKYYYAGRDIKQVGDLFKKSAIATSYPMIYGLQSSMDKMFLDSTFIEYAKPSSKAKNPNEFFKINSSDLLIATRPHIDGERILAAEAEKNVLATAFWEVILKDEKFKPLIILWFNSTFGFLLHLGFAVNSQGQIFKFKKGHLLKIPIPTDLDLAKAETLFNSLKTQTIEPYPDEFELASNGNGVRKQIDDFFISEFNSKYGLTYDLSNIYTFLSKEPSLKLEKPDYS